MFNNYLSLLFIIFILLSCNSFDSQSSTPYKAGQIYRFDVEMNSTIDESEIVDTLILEIKNRGVLGNLLGMNMSEWRSTNNPNYKEERGINITSDFIELQMPMQLDYLENENIIIAGYPSFFQNMPTGSYSESEHHFPESYGKLAGQVLKQYKVIIDSAEIEFNNKTYRCKVSNYENMNAIDEFGLYQMRTYYSEQHGFLKILYEYPNNKRISLNLIDIEQPNE